MNPCSIQDLLKPKAHLFWNIDIFPNLRYDLSQPIGNADSNLKRSTQNSISNKPARNLFSRGSLAILLIGAFSLLTGCGRNETNTIPVSDPTPPGAHSYQTNFPLTENPISEGGKWIGGRAAGASLFAGGHIRNGGRLFGDVQTKPGFAFGVDEPTEFGDPTAILSGTWGPTQTISATVKVVKAPTKVCCREVELRLRTTISPHTITGYEAYCSVMPDKRYCHIARWNGPTGSYWNFETAPTDEYVVDGDVLKATINGTNPTIITLYKNGAQILQASDTGAAGGGFGAYGPFPSGNPGIGFYGRPDISFREPHDPAWQNFGFSSFTATDKPE
jgi:hypothetical protein